MLDVSEIILNPEPEKPAKKPQRTKLKGFIMMRTGLKSNREIGEAIGYKGPVMWQIFSGEKFPSPTIQIALCKLLGISLGELKKLL